MNESFELEEQLLQCWNLVDELKFLNEAVMDTGMSPDDVSNVLMGLTTLYGARFEKLFSTFERTHTEFCRMSKLRE